MFNHTVLLIMQSNCRNAKLEPYAQELDLNPNFDQESHFARPLAKIFKNIIQFDIGEAYCEYGVIQANEMIIDIVKEHKPKYVIWPTMTYEILEETFQKVRKLNSYVILWFFDDECRFDDYSRWWIPYIDYIFTVDKTSIERYNQLGAKAYHLLVTGNPDDYKPLDLNTSYEVSFIGTRRIADRDNLVKQLLKDGVQISTFGSGWDNGFVSNEEMAEIFNSSKINICFTKSYLGEGRNQLKGKIFDITMCGGFLLCEYVDGIEEFFEIGKEIVCYRAYSEALEKINYFLINDEERIRVAEAGKIRAIEALAQHKLFENIFRSLEIDIDSNTNRVFPFTMVQQMPRQIQMAHAQYHLRWGNVLKKIGVEKKYWQDEFNLAYQYVSRIDRMRLKHRKITLIVSKMRIILKRIINLNRI